MNKSLFRRASTASIVCRLAGPDLQNHELLAVLGDVETAVGTSRWNSSQHKIGEVYLKLRPHAEVCCDYRIVEILVNE